MRPLVIALLTVLGLAAPAQDLKQRFGLNFSATIPSDTAGKLYGKGWKIGVPFYFRIGMPVEGRLRVEFGHFNQGKAMAGSYGVTYGPTSASTRLVSYDWLINLGERRQETGVDFIIGIGGAHWWREYTYTYSSPGFSNTRQESDHELAFAGTVGFRFRINPNLAVELHQVLTSLPGSSRDFKDAELSHTSIGLGVRF
ncbi:MAG: outer membrane beta-barrel protein [Acidobacteria bacterium]|nr:outer membrane beta-barrel protein [Acidobacteriota bacterium]